MAISNARILRGEGRTEAIGPLSFQVTSGGAGGIGGASDTFTVSFTAPITAAPADLTTVIACALAATPDNPATVGALLACPAGFSAIVSATGVTITVPAREWTNGERIVVQNIRIDVSSVTGLVRAFVSASTTGLSFPVTVIGISNAIRPSFTAELTSTVDSPGLILLTTCNRTATGTTTIDVTESFAQAFATAAQEKALTAPVAVTNGTQLQVIVSGVPPGFTVFGANSAAVDGLTVTAQATFLGGNLAGSTSFVGATSGGTLPGGFGDVVLTWEITAADDARRETVSLPMTLKSTGRLTPVAAPASITARVRVSPVTGFAPAVTAGATAAQLNAAGVPAPYNTAIAAIKSGTVGTGAAGSKTVGIIPRFIDNTIATGIGIGTIRNCTTTLLFPFVFVNSAGFDTSIAIANTSADAFGTPRQTGTCTVTGFRSNLAGSSGGRVTMLTTANVVPGGMYATSLANVSAVSAGFAGSVVATCNFLYAQGYALVANGFKTPAAQSVSHGYLALILN